MMLQTIDMIVREVHIGLWFLVVGYYFFIFIFMFFFRWRKSRNPFQLALALFFLFLAIGRCFYFVGDFYADVTSLYDDLQNYSPVFLPEVEPWLRAGGFFQWMALATLAATAGFLIIGKKWAEIGFAIPAVGIGLGLAFQAQIQVLIPTYTLDVASDIAGIAGVGYALFIPLLFWYLSWQSGGILRKSNFILGFGFLILFAGRVIHAGRHALAGLVYGSYTIPGVLAPGLIVIGLILIAFGNEWGQTQ